LILPDSNLKKRLAILASGAGSNARNLIENLKGSDKAEVVLVLTNRKHSGVLNVAEENNINALCVGGQDLSREGVLLGILNAHDVDAVVLAGFLLQIPEDVIKHFEGKMVNVHPSLLPAYGGRGMYGQFVHEAVFANKEKQSGITIHLVNEHYDEGKVLFQARVDIDTNDNVEVIERKVRELEIRHFPAVVVKWVTEMDSAKNSQTV